MDLRWILIFTLLAIGDSFCDTFASVPPNTVVPSEVDCQPYVEKAIKELGTSESTGSIRHDDNRNHEIPTDGNPPNDYAKSPSTQDGNIADDSPANTPAQPKESKEEEEVTRIKINSEKDERENDELYIEENDEEINENISSDNSKEDNDVEINSEEENEETSEQIKELNEYNEENNEEKSINEFDDENETVAIIIDKELIKDNADILIDVEHLKKNFIQEVESKSSKIVDDKKSKVSEKATSKKISTPLQTFKGTKKRNPKYWNFDPDEFPSEENRAEKKIEKKRRRNPKYWHFDPDDDGTNTEENKVETPKPDNKQKLESNSYESTFKGTKKRNPKYWNFDPDEFPTKEDTTEKKTEKKRKRNPKYWHFDPDDDGTNTEENKVETPKPDNTQKLKSNSYESTFKGTKKRNPKYWNFDPDDYPIEEEKKEEPVIKSKRNPKYWLFDPDEYPKGIDKTKEEKLYDKKTKDSAAEDRKVENLQKDQYLLKEIPQKNEKLEEKLEYKDTKKEITKKDESLQAKIKETQQDMYWKTGDDEKLLKRETREAIKPLMRPEKTTKIKVEVQVEDSLLEEDLTMDEVLPKNLRNKAHIKQTLQIGENTAQHDSFLSKVVDATLKELKKVYDTAIKPLETTFKYKDLSNRHFGEPEIFSKPLVLFMGPWSGGKSSIINYLLDIEYSQFSLRTGAEPSPAYFNILMYNNREAILDGTQLAADWTFSGLQKFGQGLLDRLRGLKLPHPLLEKVNIVEIPGIMEMRKHVDRVFPFNDVCQWFIDRADVIFLVYDPAKLDVGPETEAILDQLKGREYQTRIVLNKADKIRAEELMRIQGTLIWNISPLMSSAEPPIIYPVSLWSNPYEAGSPARLLHSQELAFLKDIRTAIDKRVENKIASARRFAVRVRNHAKMVDCYLTTYYNHKTFFGNKKKISDDIIEHPQNYHIYEGLSTLKNISRYDLPDPDVYRDFFHLNPIYEFKRLSETCTYFRGCPINKLDMAIAYDLPDLIGQYKRQEEELVTIDENEP